MKHQLMKVRFLPIKFDCPLCGAIVETVTKDGSRVGCKCITVDYGPGCTLGGVSGIIPTPGDLIPRMREGEGIDYGDIITEASFRWGRLVERIKGA